MTTPLSLDESPQLLSEGQFAEMFLTAAERRARAVAIVVATLGHAEAPRLLYDLMGDAAIEEITGLAGVLGYCTCVMSLDPEHGSPHTPAQHERDSCGGTGSPEPCGGCYDCLDAMAAHWSRQREVAG